MDTKQPEALAQECADYATSLRSTINVVKLEGREPPVSFLRAADLFERAAARIAALEALAAGYNAARLEIASLQAQLEAIGAGGVEPLRKREKSEPVAWVRKIVLEMRAMDDAQGDLLRRSERVRMKRPADESEYVALYAAQPSMECLHQISEPAQPVAPAQAGEYPELPERTTFEDWIKKDGGDLRTFGSGQNTHYCNSAVNNAWSGWQASAARGAAQAAPVDATVQRDAEQYRHIRRFGLPIDAFGDCDSYYGVYTSQTGECLDAAIRAAIAAQQGEKP